MTFHCSLFIILYYVIIHSAEAFLLSNSLVHFLIADDEMLEIIDDDHTYNFVSNSKIIESYYLSYIKIFEMLIY